MVDFRQDLSLNSKPIVVIVFTNGSISVCKWIIFNGFNVAPFKS